MLKMSFYDGTLNRKKLIEFIENTDKRIEYTYGLAYRHPTTYHKLISKENAMAIAQNACFLDADEYSDYLHLNAYSDNDMF